jgi:hypothetical protein
VQSAAQRKRDSATARRGAPSSSTKRESSVRCPSTMPRSWTAARAAKASATFALKSALGRDETSAQRGVGETTTATSFVGSRQAASGARSREQGTAASVEREARNSAMALEGTFSSGYSCQRTMRPVDSSTAACNVDREDRKEDWREGESWSESWSLRKRLPETRASTDNAVAV